MVINIQGVGFENKGAELMLYATVQQLRKFSDQFIIASDLRCGTPSQRTSLNLHHLTWAEYTRLPFQIGPIINTIASVLPSNVSRKNRIVIDKDIDVILDASGFLYSDQFGYKPCERMASRMTNWKKAGKKIILLPQAFGPFENPKSKSAMLEILKNTDLIFARDKVSYDHLINLGGASSHIKMAPDFTNLVEGITTDIGSGQPCIIPNSRMIRSTSNEIKANYIPFLANCVQYFLGHGLDPFILIHEAERDVKIAEELNTIFDNKIKIVREPNPLVVKGILSNCLAVVSSRYHGLISALSQEVPCVATGWSHKYQMLFDDYNIPDLLVSPLDTKETLYLKLDSITKEPDRQIKLNCLKAASASYKKQAQKMWDEVFSVIC